MTLNLSQRYIALVLIAVAAPTVFSRPSDAYDNVDENNRTIDDGALNPIANPIVALRQLAEEATIDCYEDEANTLKISVEHEGFEGLVAAQTPPNRNMKCIRYCIMRYNQLLDKAQHLNEEAMLHFLGQAYLHNNSGNNNNGDGGGITEESLKGIISTCKQQASHEADSCERSHLVSTCILAHLNDG